MTASFPLQPARLVPDAYHGTDRGSAQTILSSGFQASTGEKQYLGDGVYFFESARDQAEKWAKRKCKENGYSAFAVLQADIHLGRCLNLLDERCRRIVSQIAVKLAARGREVTDATAINAAGLLYPIDTVRAARSRARTGTLFAGSKFDREIELIICVRNKANITNVRLALSGVV